MKAKNRQKNLSSRINDWALALRERNLAASAVQQRKETGGFHKPGSNKK